MHVGTWDAGDAGRAASHHGGAHRDPHGGSGCHCGGHRCLHFRENPRANAADADKPQEDGGGRAGGPPLQHLGLGWVLEIRRLARRSGVGGLFRRPGLLLQPVWGLDRVGDEKRCRDEGRGGVDPWSRWPPGSV